MEFTSLRDLINEVKGEVPGKSDNEVLNALRSSARKFMNTGNLYKHTFTVTLDEDETEYRLTMPDDVWIQSIIDQDEDVAFDGLYTITFDSAYYATDDEYEVEAYLGYKNTATDYPEWIIQRYSDGIVAGARAVLIPSGKKHYNRIFHENLSSAMRFAGTFNGVKANDSQ